MLYTLSLTNVAILSVFLVSLFVTQAKHYKSFAL